MNEPSESGIEMTSASGAEKTVSPQKRILVVDADPTVRQMLTRVLVEEGYSVWSAANGIAAVEIAGETGVTAVLLDLNLPDKSGWETYLRLISLNPALIVIVTGDRSKKVLTGAGSGVAALFEKPLNFSKLLEAIGVLLKEPAEQRLARAAEVYPRQPKPKQPKLKFEYSAT